MRAYIHTQPQDAKLTSHCKLKGKDKVRPGTGREDPEGEEMSSSTLSLTSALGGVGDKRHA